MVNSFIGEDTCNALLSVLPTHVLTYHNFAYLRVCSNTLLSNVDNNNYSIEIVMEDIAAEDEDLHDALNSSPNEYLPAVRLKLQCAQALKMCQS